MSIKNFLKRIIPVSLARFQKAGKKQKEEIKAQKKELEGLKAAQEKSEKELALLQSELAQLREEQRKTASDTLRL